MLIKSLAYVHVNMRQVVKLINKILQGGQKMNKTGNGQFNMKYSLATNFDRRLIEEISRIDTDKSIKSVYGKLKSDVVGGGRPSMFLPELSMDELKDYIDLCHENGLEFNYLLNPMCLGNKELLKDSRNEIVNFIGNLVDVGVDWLTINSPYLCKVVKREFPNIKISVGVHAGVCELQHIKHWEKIKIDEITLQMYTTRNFGLIEEMLRYTKDTGIALRVFANVFCLHNCSYRISHSTGQAHASMTGDSAEKLYLDYNTMTCTYEKVMNLVNLISSEWIRPEVVKYYEELCEKTGNNNFSIKLVERTKSTDFLLRVAKAYLSKSYDGNLLDLMLWPSVKSPLAILSKLPAASEAAATREIPQEFKVFSEFYKLPEIYIDNKKLDGFIKKFITNYDCNQKICAVFNSAGSNNKKDKDGQVECSYCKQWVEKAISYDSKEIALWAGGASGILNAINDGSIFDKV